MHFLLIGIVLTAASYFAMIKILKWLGIEI